MNAEVPITLVLAALAAAACVTLLARYAPALGLVDHPAGRKTHQVPTPLVGGLGLALGALIAFFVLYAASPAVRLALSGTSYVGLIVGAAGMVALGAIDDRTPIAAKLKMAAQLVFILPAVLVDQVQIGSFGITVGPIDLSLGPALVPITILVMLTIVNALNMIDGVDGLAGGIAFCALALMTKAAVAGGFSAEIAILTAFLGALVGFLLINFPLWPGRKARVFLGDGGTLLLGFMVAYFAVSLSALPNRVFRPSTAIWFFFIPVADAMLLCLRRYLMDRAPARPGRDHIHHILLNRWPGWLTTWTLVGVSALLGAAGYAAERLGVRSLWLLTGWVMLFLTYAALTHRSWIDAWRRSHPTPDAPKAPAADRPTALASGFERASARALRSTARKP
jgi:UDP-GlcNAc:undecaprenyl-phosphate/decaprenyl-phosphate GlcNAc-1-phosphate transferase